MKAWILKHGRAVGGFCGIGTAIAFWFDIKPLGIALAGATIALVVLAERAKSNA
ncbi:hypothetical protein [Burkholderia ambifaria]|uniref:hypothetical protein n=1 Tax=Burkholderia ambifaria TaxID=152480 RepID=UPI002FE2F922